VRSRKDHAAETTEDYAEAIYEICEQKGRCRVVDLSKRFGVSHVTVVKILKRLQGEGFVMSVPYGPTSVTQRGAAVARRAKRRHRTVYEFLLALGVDDKTAAMDAEGMEHHVSEVTLRQLESFIANKAGQPEDRFAA
jgi:DtxR family manganese transport transcriptional regulator